MFESSSIEINQEAYRNNINFIKNQCGPGVRFCSVVKGNAYGHGMLTFVKMAMDVGVDYFAVYSTDEAYRIRTQISDQVDVMIMGNTDDQALQWSIENSIEIYVFDLERLIQAIAFANASNQKAKIHVEVETGMNRTGFLLHQLPQVFKIIKENKEHIDFIGYCTHYAGAESLVNDFRVQQQIQLFEEAKTMLKNADLKSKYIHSACSAAMINYPETVGDLVRIGIMQYGFWPNEETLIRYNGHSRETDQTLKRLISWKSQIMAVKKVTKGEFIGYNTSYQAYADMTIGVIPVGYAFGYSRSLSNTGKVLVRGLEAPICGIVNMNALCVDITHIPEVIKSDEVVLIGNQGENTITVASFGEMSDQLNYELLTRLPHDIPRKTII